MKKAVISLIAAWMSVLIISSCAPAAPLGEVQPTFSPIPTVVTTPTTTIPPRLTPTAAPVYTHTDLDALDGPLLLIETDFNQFQILDMATRTFHPFEVPATAHPPRLGTSLSPSGKEMILHIDDETILIWDLVTGETLVTYDLTISNISFDPVQVAQTALKILPEGHYTFDTAQAAIEKALVQSKQILRWYPSEGLLLSVSQADQTSTSLFLDDLQTGTRRRLEDLPGLVADFWVSPDGVHMLLKKAFVFEPGIWQDDRYYLVNIPEQTVELLPMPDAIAHPMLFWLTEQTIGITHQSQPVGGKGFSVFNIPSQETLPILTEAFVHLRMSGDKLFIVQQDRDAGKTNLSYRSLAGEIIETLTIDDLCYFHTHIGGRVILNCESESLILDNSTIIEVLSEPVIILSPSPNRQAIVLVTRSEDITLLEWNMGEHSPVTLEGTPLEIHWLPDSSGFLYRTHGSLYVYQLESQKSEHLLTSDIFSDYANLNAVWVNLE